MGEVAGTSGHGRRRVHSVCAAGLGGPLSVGALPNVRDRGPHAIDPYAALLAQHARPAPVNARDATPWDGRHTLAGLGGMARAWVALALRPTRRSQAAVATRRDDGAGRLVRAGDGVSQRWAPARHTGWAPLLRTARQRRWPLAPSPPTGGEGRAWSARRCRLIEQEHARHDAAGRWARRLLRALAAVGVFPLQQGVEPTNHRAERA